MQTLSKKRKVEHSFGNYDDDDDWGNDITAEEFDFIHSQIVDVTTAPVASTSVALMQPQISKDLDEAQLVEKGEIHMLRQKLEQKSNELEKERQDKVYQLQQNLKLHQEEKDKLSSRIDSLESSLKFKDHELKTEQLKTKKVERKVIQPLQTTQFSPTKRLALFSVNFEPKTDLFPTSSPTKHMINSNNRKSVLLKHNHAYSNCKYSLSNIPTTQFHTKMNTILSSEISMASFNTSNIHNVYQTYIDSLPKLHVYSTCYCSNKAQLCKYFPTKEVSMFESYVKQLREFSNSFFTNALKCDLATLNKLSPLPTIDISNKNVLLAQSQIICSLLASVGAIINSSEALCHLLIKSLQKQTDTCTIVSGEELLSVIAVCAKPLFCNQEIINKSMIEWSFIVLITISNYCSNCCSNLFLPVIHNIDIFSILNGSCSVETAYLALKLLEHCTGIKALFTHQNELCIFCSMLKLLESCLPANNSTLKSIEIVVVCCNLISNIVVLHGVMTVYNSQCACVAEILDQVFKWVFLQSALKESTLLPVFHLIHTLYKLLESEKWFELRSRIRNNYILTLSKICYQKDFTKPALKDIVMEFWEQETLRQLQ